MRKLLSCLKIFTSIVATVVLTMQPCRGNEEPFESWKLKADKGDPEAEFRLALMYARGTGVARDEAEAAKWYRKAADHGDADAQFNLGVMYDQGTGVVKDGVEAYKWMLLAGAQGHETAKSSIPNIEKKLAPQRRAEGQKLANEFKPRNHSTIRTP